MVLPLSLFAIIAVLGLVTTMTGLNQGVRTQVYRTNNQQLSFLIAYSAFSRVCAKIHTFSWASRPFLKEPYIENKVALQDGFYDLFAENTAGKDFQADIYVRTTLAGITRMFFWRIRVNEDLLDISNNIITEMYATADPEDFPVFSGPRPIAGKVNDLLAKRAANQKKSDHTASELVKMADPESILRKIGARVPGDFEQNWPVSAREESMNNKRPVVPVSMAPQPAVEKPGSPGPGQSSSSGTTPSSSNSGLSGTTAAADSMSGFNVDGLAQQILSSSESLLTNTTAAWDEVSAAGNLSNAANAQDYFEQASISQTETYDALDKLVSGVKDGIDDAPSPEVREALETKVAQTVAAAMKSLASALALGTDHLVTAHAGFLRSLTTVEQAEEAVTGWSAALETHKTNLGRLSSMRSSVSGYSMPSEIRQTMDDALAGFEDTIVSYTTAVAAAEARVAELKALEAQANAELSSAEQDPPIDNQGY